MKIFEITLKVPYCRKVRFRIFKFFIIKQVDMQYKYYVSVIKTPNPWRHATQPVFGKLSLQTSHQDFFKVLTSQLYN